MELKRISKKEAHSKYGVCTSGTSSLCQFFLRSDGCVVDETNSVRYCPPLAAHKVALSHSPKDML